MFNYDIPMYNHGFLGRIRTRRTIQYPNETCTFVKCTYTTEVGQKLPTKQWEHFVVKIVSRFYAKLKYVSNENSPTHFNYKLQYNSSH